MSLAHLIANLLRASSGKAFTLSGLVHVGALLLLAQSWFVATVERPRLAGSRQAAIQLEASFRETPSPVPVIVETAAIDVTPNVAHALNRTFVETPSVEIDWTLDATVRAAESALNDVAPPSVRRASDTDQLLATDSSPSVELPRSRIEPTPPRTPTAVPRMLGNHETTPPTYDHIPPPRYPDLARQRGWHGTVTLVVKIDATGRVTHVEVEESSGYQLLDAAAVNAVRRWRYKPAIGINGPVATEELQPVTFRLPR